MWKRFKCFVLGHKWEVAKKHHYDGVDMSAETLPFCECKRCNILGRF